MWVMLPTGFYSTVAHWDKPGWVVVRSRKRADLTALNTGRKIERKAQADYEFRVEMPAPEWAAILAGADIDYTNFKDEVKKHNKVRAETYATVWRDLLAIEREGGHRRKFQF